MPPRKTLEDIALVLIIILVGLGAFGLGRLSAEDEEKDEFKVTMPATAVNIPQGGVIAGAEGKVVASKNSDKYHFEWCPGAKSMSEKNKIWFDSATLAENAGYSLASNCK